jgi:hypothetical protein
LFEFESPVADSLRLRADKVYATRHTPSRHHQAGHDPGEIIAEIPARPVELVVIAAE